MHPFARLPWAFIAATLLSAGVAVATTVVPPSFEQLTSQAQLVIRAEVRGLRCEETTYNGRPVIHTYVAVNVLRSLKGVAPEALELRLLGGTVGDRTLHVPGVPRFTPGERCVLFIENNGTQFCPLVAVMHGCYRIDRGEGDGVERVRRDNGAPLRTVSDVALPMGAAIPAVMAGEPMTLDAFETAILNQLAHDAAPTH